MKKGIIITLPRHDDVTEYLSQFSKEILVEASRLFIPIKEIKDDKVNKKEVESVLNSFDYNFVIFNGHGSYDEIYGNKKECIINVSNSKLLKKRITYARSCDAAVFLGKSYLSDEECFIGYDRPFQFYINKQWIGNPLKDNVARLFLEPSNQVPISIIKRFLKEFKKE